jgi:hypothetical protein
MLGVFEEALLLLVKSKVGFWKQNKINMILL